MFSSMIKMHGQALVDRWIATEKQIVQVVERTVPQGERLAPGIVYVGVAALAGPIFTRRRNFAIRWTSPFVFASLASFYFLPGTANVVLRNIWGRYGDPKTIDNIRDRWQSVKRAEREFRDGLADSIQELRLSLQEGRKFSSDSKNHHGVKETVASIAAPVVEETREIAETVSGMAAAATENIKSGISSSSTYNRVREVSNDIVHPMKSAELTGKKEEKKQLPLGFKEKTD
ncbi:apolipo protein O-domain-containing protein [Coemansia spiralis]|nr:apolipo protein O-domain-containing protein [Coemansia spiralis]